MAGNSIAENLKSLQRRISESCKSAGRAEADVQLIAVSKTKTISEIREAYNLGVRNFAENYAQELKEKSDQLSNSDILWHFIGPLQTNKVRFVVGHANLIHSVDRKNLVEEINKVAGKLNLVQDVLLQINVSKEASKSGVDANDAEDLVHTVLAAQNLRLLGLMTMPPETNEPEASREYFQKLRLMSEKFQSVFGQKLCKEFGQLSMGSSQDFSVAIEEGSTYIRVGTDIFGRRNP